MPSFYCFAGAWVPTAALNRSQFWLSPGQGLFSFTQ